MRQFICEIPIETIEAAHLETSSNTKVLIHVVLPCVSAGLITVALLAFAESWNMVEQPLVLLTDHSLYPLSIRLNDIQSTAINVRFAGSILFLLPAILLYLFFENELLQGVQSIKL